jgi:hypothetical protein
MKVMTQEKEGSINQTLMEKLKGSDNKPSLNTSILKLKSVVKKQNDILNTLFKEIKNLVLLKATTRSNKIKDAINNLNEISDSINEN